MNLSNYYYDDESAAMHIIRTGISQLTPNELKQLRDDINNELERPHSYKFITALSTAIEAAQRNNFQIEIGTKNDHFILSPSEGFLIKMHKMN